MCGAHEHRPRSCRVTHIDSYMAHDASVVREANVFVLVVHAVSFDGAARPRLVVDDKGAGDIDFDGAGIGDSLFQAGRAFTMTVLKIGGRHIEEDVKKIKLQLKRLLLPPWRLTKAVPTFTA